jgi:ParB family transcriptional regulator, chromosome partitioning protein
MAQNYGLGRGLSSLIPQKKSNTQTENKPNQPQDDFNYFGKKQEDVSRDESKSILNLEIFKITSNPHQPRFNFDAEKLKELAESIKEHGIIQPLVVSKINANQFELIVGERRLQAAKLAGLKVVPVILREAGGQEKLELAIIENIQRHDLNPIEEAKSFHKLQEEFGLSQEEIAKKLGKGRSAVANKIRLLSLPIEIQKALLEEKITEGHAKAILAIENPEKQKALFELILKNNLTVRQVENKAKEVSVKSYKRNISQDPEIKRIEDMLTGALGTKVKLSKAGGGGKIIIDYYSKEELNNILDKIHL